MSAKKLIQPSFQTVFGIGWGLARYMGYTRLEYGTRVILTGDGSATRYDMKRYSGDGLPKNPKIALISNDALGNFAIATPIAQLLRSNLRPSAIHYFGGTRIQQMSGESDLFEASYAFHGMEPFDAARLAVDEGPYDLVMSLESTPFAKVFSAILAGESGAICGPCVGQGGRGELPFPEDERGELWADKAWIAQDLTERFPFLNSGFIAEIFVRLAYLNGELPLYRLPMSIPDRPLPDILVATAASLPEKLWPVEKWGATLNWLKRSGHVVGLIGAKPGMQREFWQGEDAEDQLVGLGLVEDLRGEFTLPEVVGALSKAKLALSLDNGIMHFAVAAGAPSVALFRFGIHRLWAPPYPNLTVLTPGDGKTVAELEPEIVIEACAQRLAR